MHLNTVETINKSNNFMETVKLMLEMIGNTEMFKLNVNTFVKHHFARNII